MEITYDPAKWLWTRAERDLDFTDAPEVFAGHTFNFPDERKDYGELRMITVGLLRGRMIVMVGTPRGEARHIISMRKANDREKARYGDRLGQA